MIKWNELDIENIADWPNSVRYVLMGFVALLVLLLGYFLDIQSQLDNYEKIKSQETDLRRLFERKQQESVNLPAYITQMKLMQKTFGTLLQKLPSKTEIPVLLEDISDAGIRSGLTFKLFKPLPEQDKVFYAEMPIEISVEGQYHALANFVSKVANLKRIVVLHDFTLKPVETRTGVLSAEGESLEPDQLNLTIMAWTYRYINEDAK